MGDNDYSCDSEEDTPPVPYTTAISISEERKKRNERARTMIKGQESLMESWNILLTRAEVVRSILDQGKGKDMNSSTSKHLEV